MSNRLKEEISVTGVPFDMAASQMGTRLGPEAIKISGLLEKLEHLGYDIKDLGNLDIENGYKLIKSKNKLNHLDLTIKANEKLAEVVAREVGEDRLPLILGGDHSIFLGSVKGVLSKYENLGIIYFDAHADINTAETTPTGNIHGMTVASALGIGEKSLCDVYNKNLKIKPENILYIGLRDVDPGEVELIRELGIKTYTMEDIEVHGMENIMKEGLEFIKKKNLDGVHISFDIDCLDPKVAPGTGVKVPGGLSFREARLGLVMTSELDNIVSTEFVEVNPLLDSDNETSEIASTLISSLFGESLT